MENAKESCVSVVTPGAGAVQLSEYLAKPLENLYKTGGLALVFVFVGLISMMAAFAYKSDLSNWMFGVGTAITFVCVGVFYFNQVYGPIKVRKVVRENKELIDSFQTVAIRLTDTIAGLQSLMFKHSEQVAEILEAAAPVLADLPMIGKAAFSQTQNVNALIVKTTEAGKKVIEDVRTALVTCDATKLREYASELEHLRTTLREALSKQASVPCLSTARDLAVTLQESVSSYMAIVDDVNARAADFVALIDRVLSAACRLPIVGVMIEQLGGRTALEKAAEFRTDLDRFKSTTANLRLGISGRDPAALRVCLHDMKAVAVQFERLRGATPVESVPDQGMEAVVGTETPGSKRPRRKRTRGSSGKGAGSNSPASPTNPPP
jgi:hypothetical protein